MIYQITIEMELKIMKDKFHVVFRILWSFSFILIVILNNDSPGEAGLLYALLLLLLTFPIGLFVFFVVGKFFIIPSIFGDWGLTIILILMFIAGYYQWFILIPQIKTKLKKGNR